MHDTDAKTTYIEPIRPGKSSNSSDADCMVVIDTKEPTLLFKFLSRANVEAQYHEEIYRMTIIDGLTQIHNKRYLYDTLERELIRGRRNERDLAILMFDIDHFKRINDVHGHMTGDFVLKELARIVQSRIRRDEVFARYGGEEFVIMFPDTSLEFAECFAEMLQKKVAEHVFVSQAGAIRVTISIGCAFLRESDRAANDLIKRAYERCYFAKYAKGNRSVSPPMKGCARCRRAPGPLRISTDLGGPRARSKGPRIRARRLASGLRSGRRSRDRGAPRVAGLRGLVPPPRS